MTYYDSTRPFYGDLVSCYVLKRVLDLELSNLNKARD